MLSRGSASTVKHQPATHSKRVDWRMKSACFTYYARLKAGEKDIFFPPPGKPGAEVDEALQYCNSCPVRQACLDYALEKGETRDGIFGGLLPHERKYLKQKAQKAQKAEAKKPAPKERKKS